MKKIFNILLIVLFPLGILYCVLKNLTHGDYKSFLGGVFLFGLGFLLSIILLRYDLIQAFFGFFGIIV